MTNGRSRCARTCPTSSHPHTSTPTGDPNPADASNCAVPHESCSERDRHHLHGRPDRPDIPPTQRPVGCSRAFYAHSFCLASYSAPSSSALVCTFYTEAHHFHWWEVGHGTANLNNGINRKCDPSNSNREALA
jgi:hypothetical protein